MPFQGVQAPKPPDTPDPLKQIYPTQQKLQRQRWLTGLRQKEQFGKGKAPDKKGAEPPLPSDKKQSATHLVDSVLFNAAHSVTHAKEAASHAKKLRAVMRKNPEMHKHLNNLTKVRGK